MTILSHSERGSGLRVRLSPGASGWYLGGGAVAIGVYFRPAENEESRPLQRHRLSLRWRRSSSVLAALKPRGAPGPCLFAVGLVAEVIADTISGFYEIHFDREPPLASVAGFYLGGYPLLALGIFLLLRRRGVATTLAASLDTVIVAVAVATVQWIFFVEPVPDTWRSGRVCAQWTWRTRRWTRSSSSGWHSC